MRDTNKQTVQRALVFIERGLKAILDVYRFETTRKRKDYAFIRQMEREIKDTKDLVQDLKIKIAIDILYKKEQSGGFE